MAAIVKQVGVAYFNLQDFSGWLNRKKKYQPEIKSPSHE
jgi:hypothetical protein